MSYFKKILKTKDTNIEEESASSAEGKGATKNNKNKLGQLKNSLAGKIIESKNNLIEQANNTKKKVQNFEYSSLKSTEFYVEGFNKTKDFTSEKVSQSLKKMQELDISVDEMVDSLRSKQPIRPADLNDIYLRCRQEVLQRTMSVFFLTPAMLGLDQKREGYYSNLSMDYKTFKNDNLGLTDHTNFSDMKNARYEAREHFQLLENGYNKGQPLSPYDTDIEHVTSKKEIYSDLILRLGTTDEEIIDAMNASSNLVNIHQSVNRSKGSKDLLEYIQKGRPNPDNPGLIDIDINGDTYHLSQEDVAQAYQNSKEGLSKEKTQALTNIGVSLGAAGVTMAMQQAVGLMIAETIDIFFDELKSLEIKDNLFKPKKFKMHIESKSEVIANKLKIRFEEKDLFRKAKDAGIEGGVSGVISAIPQILISIYLRLPGLILALIREGTLSIFRSVRILRSNSETKYDDIKVVLFGAATAALGIYVANIITKAIMSVPLLNTFNKQVTDILTTLVVTAVPLTAIYIFDASGNNLRDLITSKKNEQVEDTIEFN